MARLRTRKWLLAALASLTSLLAVGFYALAQAPDEGKRDRKVAVAGGTFHVLPATLETTQWGWLDPAEPPKLVVNSGDTVAVETMMHAHNKIQPGTTMDEIVALRKANPGGGPHSHDRPHLRERGGAGRRDGDPHPQDHAQGLRHQLQPARQGVPHHRRARVRDAGRLREVLLPRPRQEAGRVQARRHHRPAAVPGHPRGGHRSQGPLAAQGRLHRSDGAGLHAPAVEERLQHGHQRAAGGHDHLHPGLPQGRRWCGPATRTAARATARST